MPPPEIITDAASSHVQHGARLGHQISTPPLMANATNPMKKAYTQAENAGGLCHAYHSDFSQPPVGR